MIVHVHFGLAQGQDLQGLDPFPDQSQGPIVGHSHLHQDHLQFHRSPGKHILYIIRRSDEILIDTLRKVARPSVVP